MYKCEVCNVEFDAYNKFSVHSNRKHKIPYLVLKEKYFPPQELSFKCNRCTKSFNTYDSLRKHSGRIHKIQSYKFYVEFYLNNKWPVCQCGCGNEVKWDTGLKNFCNYIAGHHARIKNNWSKDSPHFKKSVEHSADTRRKQFASGERTVWCKGLTKETSKSLQRIGEMSRKENNPERAKKISNTQKQQFIDGIRDNHGKNNPMYGKKHSPETIKKIFSYRKMNLLESAVAKLFDEYKIKYHFQFFISDNGICKSYDFKIKGKPILIELDGDYWHGGPGAKIPYEKVNEVKENDKFKNKMAKNNGYKLLRFWESDIKENPAKVMKTLLNELSI
jgi:very-short-patch-repair endonuclease